MSAMSATMSGLARPEAMYGLRRFDQSLSSSATASGVGSQQPLTANSSTKVSISQAGQSAANAVNTSASESGAAPSAGDAISNYFKTTVESRPGMTAEYSGVVTADTATSLGIRSLKNSFAKRAWSDQAATREAAAKTAPSTIRDVDSSQSPSRQMSASMYAANAQPQQPVLSLLA